MKLDKIVYEEHPEEGPVPAEITVTMTAREAVWLTTVMGQFSQAKAEDVLPGYYPESHAIYGCLAGVANTHFDGGVEDWQMLQRRDS